MFESYRFVVQTAIVLNRQLPNLEESLANLPDYRKRKQYEVRELVMAVITMFLYKRGSRNHADNSAGKMYYRKNIERIFKMNLPDLDTADKLMKKLDPLELELIKKGIVSILVSRKVLYKFRLFDLFYNVAIDGTGVNSYDYEPYPECPFKEFKSGKKVWTEMVLEAKIVCSNGFSISIATEWVKNPVDKEFDKQDCESKAFARLAKKIKKHYPRLPICITADGLYPNNTFFDICKGNDWQYIVTLKDGNLKSVWKEINLLNATNEYLMKNISYKEVANLINENYKGYEKLQYQKHIINVVVLTKNTIVPKGKEDILDERFGHVTNFTISDQTLKTINYAGRLRWKIENEGFNDQKNSGYNLKHKYSRTSFVATQNYYQCLQIAHMINQLAYKANVIAELIESNDTLKSNLEVTVAILLVVDLENETIVDEILNTKLQFRY